MPSARSRLSRVASALLLPAGAAAQSYKPTSLLAATPDRRQAERAGDQPGAVGRRAHLALRRLRVGGDGHRRAGRRPQQRVRRPPRPPVEPQRDGLARTPHRARHPRPGRQARQRRLLGPLLRRLRLRARRRAEITVATKCVAFVSRASNLVPGDRNGRADVFVKRLPGGPLTRIAAPGAATGADLDGRCRKVAYAAGGTDLHRQHERPRRRSGAPRRAAAPPIRSCRPTARSSSTSAAAASSCRIRARGPRRIGSGTAPTADQWGRYVSFVSGGQLVLANLEGAPRVRPVVDKVRGGRVNGTAPSMTAGGIVGLLRHRFGDRLQPPTGARPAARRERRRSRSWAARTATTLSSRARRARHIMTYIGPR